MSTSLPFPEVSTVSLAKSVGTQDRATPLCTPSDDASTELDDRTTPEST